MHVVEPSYQVCAAIVDTRVRKRIQNVDIAVEVKQHDLDVSGVFEDGAHRNWSKRHVRQQAVIVPAVGLLERARVIRRAHEGLEGDMHGDDK